MNEITQTHTAEAQTTQDLKDSVLIVSVLVNLFVFVTWLVLETNTDISVALVSTL